MSCHMSRQEHERLVPSFSEVARRFVHRIVYEEVSTSVSLALMAIGVLLGFLMGM